MTATADDLARRLVESPHWHHPRPPQGVTGDLWRHPTTAVLWRRVGAAWAPDFGDYYTQGAMFDAAQTALGKYVGVRPGDGRQGVFTCDGSGSGWVPLLDADGHHITGDSVGLALAHAILAAPGVDDA